MSKRSATTVGGEDRYGFTQPEEMTDRPMQATAAQLAKRKIAQAKGSRRPRSESPLTNTGSIFEQANSSGLIGGNTNSANPFASNNSFTQNGHSSQTGSFASGGGSFTFGAGTNGQNTANTTPNMNSSFSFGVNAPSAPFQFGQTPAPQANGNNGSTSGFSFGQQNGSAMPQTNPFTIHDDSQTPKASNPFGTAPTNGSNGASIFNTTPATNGFSFNNSSTHQKPAETASFSGFSASNAATPKPAADGWSSFLNKPAEATQPTTNSLFGAAATNGAQTNGASTPSLFSGFGAQNKTSSFKFTSQADNDASMMSPENTPQKAATNGTVQDETPKPASKSLFERITRDDQPVSQPASSLFAPSAPAPAETAQSGSSLFAASTPAANPQTAPSLFAPSAPAVKENAQPSLFSGLAATPKTSGNATPSLFSKPPAAPMTSSLFAAKPIAPQAPPSALVSETTKESVPARASKVSSMETTNPVDFVSFRELNEGLLQHLTTQDLNRDLTSIFEYYMYEAKRLRTKTGSSVDPGYTAVDESTSQAATSSVAKPAEPLYPKLPDDASATAKFFEAALDTPAAGSTNGTSLFAKSSTAPAAPSLFAPKPASSASAAPSLFATKPTSDASAAPSLFATKPASSASAAPSLFAAKPASSASAAPSLFAPKSAGFTPTVTAPTTNGSFLSSFGAEAAKTEAKEKRRRRDEDFDSEDENEADWEKRDAEEQASKRTKLDEAAKAAAAFTFKPTASASAKPAAFVFGAADAKKDASAPISTADQTWKQGTPIKFGGASATTSDTPAPKMNLFSAAASTPGPSLFASTSKPANVFGMSQPSTTPAPTTNGTSEQQNTEDGEAEPPLAQQDDLAILLPSEKEESDVLYHVERARSKKLESRAVEGGAEKMTWIDKGHGPIWILKNKTTGVARVLQKVKDSGRIAMNFGVLPGSPKYYSHEGSAAGKAVRATFIDHLTKSSGPSQWHIAVGTKEDAAEIARILREEQSKP